jgi:hypothetical protein
MNTLFTPSEADAFAAKLNAEDDDFTYEVVHDPKKTGMSFIRVYDEDGELLGKL